MSISAFINNLITPKSKAIDYEKYSPEQAAVLKKHELVAGRYIALSGRANNLQELSAGFYMVSVMVGISAIITTTVIAATGGQSALHAAANIPLSMIGAGLLLFAVAQACKYFADKHDKEILSNLQLRALHADLMALTNPKDQNNLVDNGQKHVHEQEKTNLAASNKDNKAAHTITEYVSFADLLNNK